MSISLTDQIYQALPFLRSASAEFLDEFRQHAQLLQVPSGKTLYWEGDHCAALPVALSGQFRVFKIGENGNEITLYRFGKGESCILTTSCIFSQGEFPAVAKVEIGGEVLLIPEQTVRVWMLKYPEWQKYLCALFSKRLSDTIATIEEITFKRMDVRVIRLLLEKYFQNENKDIRLTHQQLAFELGTAREVISRILKDLEMRRAIDLSRGHIKITDPQLLQSMLKNKAM